MSILRVMLLVSLLLAGGVAAARPCGGAAPLQAAEVSSARPVAMTTAAMSINQAVQMAERRFHARVVKAETEQDGGHTVYVLRLLDDAGRVWTVRVDAANGAVH